MFQIAMLNGVIGELHVSAYARSNAPSTCSVGDSGPFVCPNDVAKIVED